VPRPQRAAPSSDDALAVESASLKNWYLETFKAHQIEDWT
jgi:hypothetical protein